MLKINDTTYTATWTEVSEHLRNGLVIKYGDVRSWLEKETKRYIAGQPATSGEIDGLSYTIYHSKYKL